MEKATPLTEKTTPGGRSVSKLGYLHIKNPTINAVGFLILQGRRFESIAVQHPGGVLLPPVQKLVATFEKTGHIKNPML
jgi:hypothetical protein